MGYIESEIFNEYVKKAEEKGLIVKEAESIEDLYDVKPNGEEEDLIDRAHPETVVIGPAHDRMNAIVENGKQRQNIMSYIALKNSDGDITQKRYVKAYEDLLDSLVSVGYMMDSRDEEELAKFADGCTEKLTKTAVGPWIIPVLKGLAWVAGPVLGWTAVTNNLMNPVSQGIINDVDNSITELKEAAQKAYPEIQSEIAALISALEHFKEIALNALNQGGISLDVQKASLTDLAKVRQDSRSLEKMRTSRKYLTALRQLRSYLPNVISSLQSASKKETNLPTFLAPLSDVYRIFDPDDLQDAYKQLATLLDTLDKEESRITSDMNKGHSQAQELAIKIRNLLNNASVIGGDTSEKQQSGALTKLVQQAYDLEEFVKKIYA